LRSAIARRAIAGLNARAGGARLAIGRGMKKRIAKSLSLSSETIRALDGARVTGGLKSIGPLTFDPCNTANCMTLGTLCPTHDCQLTFTSCSC
jgi:hypothetical protein